MQILLEDYINKLANLKILRSITKNDHSMYAEIREERMKTKEAEYRTFIEEITKAIQREEEKEAEHYSKR